MPMNLKNSSTQFTHYAALTLHPEARSLFYLSRVSLCRSLSLSRTPRPVDHLSTEPAHAPCLSRNPKFAPS